MSREKSSSLKKGLKRIPRRTFMALTAGTALAGLAPRQAFGISTEIGSPLREMLEPISATTLSKCGRIYTSIGRDVTFSQLLGTPRQGGEPLRDLIDVANLDDQAAPLAYALKEALKITNTGVHQELYYRDFITKLPSVWESDSQRRTLVTSAFRWIKDHFTDAPHFHIENEAQQEKAKIVLLLDGWDIKKPDGTVLGQAAGLIQVLGGRSIYNTFAQKDTTITEEWTRRLIGPWADKYGVFRSPQHTVVAQQVVEVQDLQSEDNKCIFYNGTDWQCVEMQNKQCKYTLSGDDKVPASSSDFCEP